MLSLYIHVPFCDKKCGYCSFFVVPTEGIDPQQKMLDGYMEGLLRDIEARGTHYKKPELRTLYFGGGTPGILGKVRLMQIIDAVQEHFDLTYLEELSIELNPNPYEEILDLIQTLNRTYKDFPRIRFSLGIQSFDDEVLQLSGRQYTFEGIQGFLRSLRDIKEPRNVINLDFIAFGKGNYAKDTTYAFWNTFRRERFATLVNSGFADSFSLYTLELFGGAAWEKTKRKEIDGESHLNLSSVPFETTQEKITAEFQALKDVIEDAGYRRYELSNFAMPGKQSLHNTIYRNMGNYLGLGPSAASFLTGKYAKDLPASLFSGIESTDHGVRFTNEQNIFGYTKEQKLDPESIIPLSEKDYRTEKFFLALRTSGGIHNVSSYEDVLVPNRKGLIGEYEKLGLLEYQEDKLTLTDEGLDVYNTIASEILAL